MITTQTTPRSYNQMPFQELIGHYAGLIDRLRTRGRVKQGEDPCPFIHPEQRQDLITALNELDKR